MLMLKGPIVFRLRPFEPMTTIGNIMLFCILLYDIGIVLIGEW